MHSPFVYNFATSVLYEKRHFYAFDAIENQRRIFIKDTQQDTGLDAGKGTHTAVKQRTVAQYARIASIAPKYGRLLFRSVNHFKALNIIELGTCLGLGTAYLASANENARVLTIEANEFLYNKAMEGFKKQGLNNITPLLATFDDILPHLADYMPSVDMAFIDGNHAYDATLRYFNTLLAHTHPKSILIFDDIHWSPDMHRAWKEIQQHPRVTATIDLGRMGLVALGPGLQKQHFVLRY